MLRVGGPRPTRINEISKKIYISQGMKYVVPRVVLRIHIILIRFQVLDPHWQKMFPDPGSQNVPDPKDPDPKHWLE